MVMNNYGWQRSFVGMTQPRSVGLAGAYSAQPRESELSGAQLGQTELQWRNRARLALQHFAFLRNQIPRVKDQYKRQTLAHTADTYIAKIVAQVRGYISASQGPGSACSLIFDSPKVQANIAHLEQVLTGYLLGQLRMEIPGLEYPPTPPGLKGNEMSGAFMGRSQAYLPQISMAGAYLGAPQDWYNRAIAAKARYLYLRDQLDFLPTSRESIDLWIGAPQIEGTPAHTYLQVEFDSTNNVSQQGVEGVYSLPRNQRPVSNLEAMNKTLAGKIQAAFGSVGQVPPNPLTPTAGGALPPITRPTGTIPGQPGVVRPPTTPSTDYTIPIAAGAGAIALALLLVPRG